MPRRGHLAESRVVSAEDPAATLGAGGVRREAERAGVRELRQRLSESERQLADTRDYLQALQEQHDATIADRRQVELFLELQNDALEMVVRGLPLTKALEALTLALEKQSRNKMMAAIHLLDAEGTHLRDCIAPSLPESYRRVTDGVDVNSKMGSCCMAVLGGATFAIEDIAADPQWSAFGGFALPLGIRASFSTPIVSSNGKIIGTFANYYEEPGPPDPRDVRVVDILTRTVALAIERKQAEEALRESDERFRNMADNIPQLAWIADANTNGQVNWFNQSWLSYTGATLGEMKGSGWKSVHHPDYVDRVAQKFEHHVKVGLDWEDTFPLRGKDGQYRWFLSRMKVIRDETGTVVRIFGTNTDITRERQMADELRRNAAEMAEADRRKTEFLALLAHELRNPLAPMRNAIQILQLAERNGEAARSASEMMERQIRQMVRLVDDLLDVSRISRGKIVLQRERVDLISAVDHAVEVARVQSESMEQDLTVTLPGQPITIDADPTRLAQVIGNLLHNASKYTEKGGRIQVTAEQEGAQAVIRVQDTGIGIAAEQLARIFDMFIQVDTSLGRAQGGLGIGLTLAKTLVEMHNGTIEAHSGGLGQGTEFVVRLPVASLPPHAQTVPSGTAREATARPQASV